jgi:hypothetical protein
MQPSESSQECFIVAECKIKLIKNKLIHGREIDNSYSKEILYEVNYRLKKPNGCLYTIFIDYTKSFDNLHQ